MDIYWIQKRAHLRQLLTQYPDWSDRQYATAVGTSRAWAQKWRQRLQTAPEDDDQVLLGHARRRKTSPKKVTEVVEAKIIQLRTELSERYHRRVGARNILYHLQRDPDLQRLGVYIPKSTSTIHQVLVRYHCVPRPPPRIHIPLERPEPMQVWELDFTDVPSAQSESTHKRQHQVEVLNIIDAGTSVAMATRASDRFDAEWTLLTLIDIFSGSGLPQVLRFDRDPRLVASWSMDRFPSAFMRFLFCVAVTPDVCPPRRPDKKPFIERFIRTQGEECLKVLLPPDVPQTQLAVDHNRIFYNLERPNQAITCNNQPPALALAHPPYLPRLPTTVNPDAWLPHYDRQGFKRQVRANGTVSVDKHGYYIGRRYRGQRVLLMLDAQQQEFAVLLGPQCIKRLPIRGLYHGEMPFAEYADYIITEARSEEQRLQRRRRLQRAG